MKQGSLIAAPLVLAVLVAGCGDDEKSNRESSYTPPTPAQQEAAASGDATKQDADAKLHARDLVTAVEACFVERQMYSACREPEGVPVGPGPELPEVAEAGTATYTVVARSKSGTSFEVVKDESGELKRTCDKPDEGGCGPDGDW